MAPLTKAGQGSNPGSAPRERGHERGHADRGTPGHPALTTARPVFDRPHQTAVHLLARGYCKVIAVTGVMLGMTVQPTGGTPTLSSISDARAGAILHRNVPFQPHL